MYKLSGSPVSHTTFWTAWLTFQKSQVCGQESGAGDEVVHVYRRWPPSCLAFWALVEVIWLKCEAHDQQQEVAHRYHLTPTIHKHVSTVPTNDDEYYLYSFCPHPCLGNMQQAAKHFLRWQIPLYVRLPLNVGGPRRLKVT